MQQIACGSHPRPYTPFKDELLEHWKSVKVSRCDATIAGACLQNERWDKCRAFFSRIVQTRAASRSANEEKYHDLVHSCDISFISARGRMSQACVRRTLLRLCV